MVIASWNQKEMTNKKIELCFDGVSVWLVFPSPELIVENHISAKTSVSVYVIVCVSRTMCQKTKC